MLYISAEKILGVDDVLHLKFSWSGKRISLILQKIEHKLKRQYSPFIAGRCSTTDCKTN